MQYCMYNYTSGGSLVACHGLFPLSTATLKLLRNFFALFKTFAKRYIKWDQPTHYLWAVLCVSKDDKKITQACQL